MTIPAARPAIPAGLRGGVVAIARRLAAERAPADVAQALAEGGVRAFEITLNEPKAAPSGRSRPSRPVARTRPRDRRRHGPLASRRPGRPSTPAPRSSSCPTPTPSSSPGRPRAASRPSPARATPTEVLAAWRAGAAAVKLFPASALGPASSASCRGPFPDIPVVPTGGVTAETAGAFIAAGASPSGWAAGWSATAPPAGVTRRARQVVAAVAAAREAPRCMTAEVVTLGECLISLIAPAPGPLAEATASSATSPGRRRTSRSGSRGSATRSRTSAGSAATDSATAIIRRLRGEGVDVSHLTIDDGATTGLMLRERRVLGAAQVVYARTGSAGSRLSIDDVDGRRRRRLRGRSLAPPDRHHAGAVPTAHEAGRHAPWSWPGRRR